MKGRTKGLLFVIIFLSLAGIFVSFLLAQEYYFGDIFRKSGDKLGVLSELSNSYCGGGSSFINCEKVSSLNDFYSTNIFSPFTIAKHIVELDIDNRLGKGDLELVNEIAIVKVNGNKKINFYSFATKYCSHHKPIIYPIYDSYVEKLLMYFKKTDKFFKFKKEDLKTYSKYKDILIGFQKHYTLEEFNLKEIDKYLWQAGKYYFPKNYRKTGQSDE